MSYTTSAVWRQSGVRLAGLSLMVAVAALGLSGVGIAQTPARTMPVFEVDTTWPTLPNNWVLGVTAAVSVDRTITSGFCTARARSRRNSRSERRPPSFSSIRTVAFCRRGVATVTGTTGPTTSTESSSTTGTTSGSAAMAKARRAVRGAGTICSSSSRPRARS